jgi:hypothetical protein
MQDTTHSESHSNRDANLKTNGTRQSFPQSRFDHFKKEDLVRILREGGVKLWNSIHLCYQLSEAIFPHASDKPVLLS